MRLGEGEMKVVFPWPPKALSPNARVHWATKAKAAKQYRQACLVLARNAKKPINTDGLIFMDVKFLPPDRRPRDVDNLIASLKAGMDGLADALEVNDRLFAPRYFPLGEVRQGGAVVVEIFHGR
jgi:crossover junction endodeoxyribonuclease RusA